MEVTTRAILMATLLPFAASEAQAGGFLQGLIGRAAVRAGASAAGATAARAKTYGPDQLTVDQLAACLKSANALDGESQAVDAKKADLEAKIADVGSRKARIEERKGKLNTGSAKAVAQFNAEVDATNVVLRQARADQETYNALVASHNGQVDAYNGRCAKRYYADDLEPAKKQAGLAF